MFMRGEESRSRSSSLRGKGGQKEEISRPFAPLSKQPPSIKIQFSPVKPVAVKGCCRAPVRRRRKEVAIIALASSVPSINEEI